MRYIFGILGAIILVILAVILIGRAIPDSSAPQPVTQQTTLTDYINGNAVVRVTMDGKIIAKEQHRAVRITVGRTSRTVEVLRGYDATVEQTKQYDNDIAAFSAFLAALQKSGYATEKQKVTQKDERGACPQGSRFIYELIDNNDEVLRTWSTSCSSSEGTFGGKGEIVRQLFQAQIPDYSTVIKGVQL